MSSASLPSGCVLDRRVRVDVDEDDEDDLIAGEHPFSILSCVDNQALGFHGHEAYEANEAIRSLDLGAHLAGAPPGLSCLVLRGGSPCTSISAVDRNVIVFVTTLHSLNRVVYLVYDAVAASLRMMPLLQDSLSRVALTSRMLIARPARGHGGGEYALALTGKLAVTDEDGGRRERDSIFLWRPSSSSRPWSEAKKTRFPYDADERVYQADEVFSRDGHGYWADLLCGVMHCSCDTLFDDNSGDDVVEFGFIHLPIEPGRHHRNGERVAQPVASRTMGVVQDSTIRFVSISGFLEHVELKDRTVTVWRLLGHGDMGWEKEHELILETLWGLEGFGDLPKNLTPMYPLLSTNDTDVVYLGLLSTSLIVHRLLQVWYNFLPLSTALKKKLAVETTSCGTPPAPETEKKTTVVVSKDFNTKKRKIPDGIHKGMVLLQNGLKVMRSTLDGTDSAELRDRFMTHLPLLESAVSQMASLSDKI